MKSVKEDMVRTWQRPNSTEEENKQAPPAQVSFLPYKFMGTHSNNFILKIPLVLQSLYTTF